MSTDLVDLYLDHEQSVIHLVGGPADGRRFTVQGARPPMAWQVPVDEPLSALTDFEPRPIPKAMYRPAIDTTGFWSRTDDGAWRYQYDGQDH